MQPDDSDYYMTTSLGLQVPIGRPGPHDIHLRDLAHHLSCITLFCGATHFPWSVAQHSVIVARLLEGLSARTALLGLLAKGHEAYLHNEPLRGLLAARFDSAILARFGIAPPDDKERQAIALMDEVAFATEWRDLMPDGVPCPKAAPPAKFIIKAQPWHKAEEDFLAMFDKLTRLSGVNAGVAA